MTILLGHFFRGLFESDLFSVRERLLTMLTGVLSLFAAFGLVLPLLFNHKYHVLHALPAPALFREAALADKLMFISISFVVTVLVTAMQWQSLFPGKQDFLILGPLPLRRFQIFLSKFLALLLFISLLIVGANVLPSLSMPGVMSGRWQQPQGSLLHVASLFLACCFASYFAFFSLLAIQALLLNLLPGRWFSSLSLLVQAGLLLVSLTMLPMLLWIPNLHASLFARPALALALPPMWFLGWGEEILGTASPFSRTLAGHGQLGLLLAIATALLLYALTYGRSVNQVLESNKQFETPLFSNLLHRCIGSPRELGILSFVLKTLFRSRMHKLLLSAIVGVSLALSFDGFFSLWVSRIVGHGAIENAALSAPLVVAFFLLCGIRYLFLLPVESRSNWTFQLSQNACDHEAMRATEISMLLLAVVPTVVITFFGFAVWLGVAGAVVRAAFVLLMALLLQEALLWNWKRIPFTCPYLPGKRNLIQSLLLYGVALTFFAYSAASIERAVLPSAGRTSGLFCVLTAAIGFLHVQRRRTNESSLLLQFDDAPEPDLQTLLLAPD